jgi:hypothetical protein
MGKVLQFAGHHRRRGGDPMKSSKIAFPWVLVEAVVSSIPEGIDDIEAFKDETVRRSCSEYRWQKQFPPTVDDLRASYRELIFELSLARKANELLPDSQADKLWAVTAAISFLQMSGFPPELIKPFQDLMGVLEDLTQAKKRRGKSGRPPTPFNELVRGAWASAAVTALSQKGKSVDQALQMVCRESGLARTWLRNFRLNILRGNSDARAVSLYQQSLLKSREHGPEKILKSVY